jgi:hypothetical protein
MAEYVIKEASQDQVASIASLWKRMISYYYFIEKNFVITDDAQERYYAYLESIINDSLIKVMTASMDNKLVGFMIGKIDIRPPVIVKGYIGIVEDYWANRLYLNRIEQNEVKKAIFEKMNNWFQEKNVGRVRLEVSTQIEDDKLMWEGKGFRSYKWVMFK